MINNYKMKKYLNSFLKIIIYIFSFIGIAFVLVFFAMKFGLTKTSGSIDKQSDYFKTVLNNSNQKGDIVDNVTFCTLKEIKNSSQSDFENIKNIYKIKYDLVLLVKMAAAYRYSWISNASFDQTLKNLESCASSKTKYSQNDINELFGKDNFNVELISWAKTDEWNVIADGLKKDKDVIDKVSNDININKRLLVMPLVVEQLRLFNSERSIFKSYFAPLRILGAQTQFSLGIYGIKEDVAKQVEKNLKDKNSKFYLGSEYENMLDIKILDNSNKTINENSKIVNLQNTQNTSTASTTNISTSSSNTSTQLSVTTSSSAYRVVSASDYERIKRLTDEKDHYYSYLYAGLYIKQIIKQWEKAGYDISNRPEIVATLYNLGFIKSEPKPNPEVGGADIDLSGFKYTFGSLGYQFYYSGLLSDIFQF